MRIALTLMLMMFGITNCLGADSFPDHAVTIVSPQAAGGSDDTIARILCVQLTKQFGRGCIVEDRPGGSEIIAAQFVAKAPPDGYTLLITDPGFAIIPNWFHSLKFNIPKDFTPISQVLASPWALVVRPGLHVDTLRDFIAYAQANPGKLNYGSSGAGGAPYMWAEQFKQAAKVNISHVPYKGASDVVTAMLGGQIDMLISTIPTVLAQVRAGNLRALAVSGDKRVAALPTVPTMTEAGVTGMAGDAFIGVLGPANMRPEVVDKLYSEIKRALAVRAVSDQYRAFDAEPIGSSPETFSRLINTSIQQWGTVIKAGGMVTQ